MNSFGGNIELRKSSAFCYDEFFIFGSYDYELEFLLALTDTSIGVSYFTKDSSSLLLDIFEIQNYIYKI